MGYQVLQSHGGKVSAHRLCDGVVSAVPEEPVLLMDPWKFFERMRDARTAGFDVTAGSYPSVYPEYQKWAAGR